MSEYTEVFGIMDEVCGIKRTKDGAFIPLDEGNVDYQEYLKWLEENPK